ncbi:MAG: DUF4157 domain-containing protein, partial [Geminicoccaceae bacterium]
MADQVMRVPENVARAAESAPAASTRGYVQRMCDECAEEETARLQRMPLPAAARISSLSASMMARSALPDRAAGVLQRQDIDEDETLQAKAATGAVPDIMPDVEARVHALRARGQPLSPDQRAFFEPRFGYDFSRARIHTDARSAALVRAVDARAFTVGRDIVFGAGEYAPDTAVGRQLLAHELVHTI